MEYISVKIMLIRGEKVMLDQDMAELSGVENKRKNEAFHRNIKRLSVDFMFAISKIMNQNTLEKFGFKANSD